MTIPDSLQTLGPHFFHKCPKLVPSYIKISNENNDTTSEVAKYIHEKMKSDQMLKINIMVEDIASLKKQVAEQGVATTEQGVANATQNEEIIAALKSKATADQTTKIASLEAELKIARLELRAENAEKENAELRAEEEIASLKQQLASTTDSKKRKHA